MLKVFKRGLLSSFAVLWLAILASDFVWAASNDRESYEANQRGVSYLEKGRLREAVGEFEKAYTLSVDNKVIRGNLVVAYNNYAVRLMEDERFLEARAYLGKAFRLDPGDRSVKENLEIVHRRIEDESGSGGTAPTERIFEADETLGKIANDFLMQGIQYYEKKEYQLAEDVLVESLEYSKTNPTAHELLGDIAYQKQDLKRAKEHYTQAFRLRRSKTLQDKIQKVGRETVVEERLDPYSDEHFIIRFKEEAPGLIGGGFEIREYLRQAYRAISQDLGFYPRGKVVVLLYSEMEYREISEAPAWSGGHFDGKIRLPAYQETIDRRAFQKLILHELTHSFVRDLSRARCPTWLNEGLAQYEENKAKPVDLNYFRVALKNRYLLSLEEMGRGIKDNDDPTHVYLFYQQSFVVVKYLIERYRMVKIKAMLTGYREGQNSDEVFKRVLKVSPRAFEIKWLASLSLDGA